MTHRHTEQYEIHRNAPYWAHIGRKMLNIYIHKTFKMSLQKEKMCIINAQSRAELNSICISIEQITSLICRGGKLTCTLTSTY